MSKLPPRGDPYWDDFDQISPWHIKDGKWGGFGTSHWLRAQEYGFAKGDVVEWRFADKRQEWYRVWIEADAKWRELTIKEIIRLPALGIVRDLRLDAMHPLPPSPEMMEAMAAVMAQPVLRVIEPAPVLVNQFGVDTTGQAV